jgi:hypothetical protein
MSALPLDPFPVSASSDKMGGRRRSRRHLGVGGVDPTKPVDPMASADSMAPVVSEGGRRRHRRTARGKEEGGRRKHSRRGRGEGEGDVLGGRRRSRSHSARGADAGRRRRHTRKH